MYLVDTIAHHSETKEKFVIYHPLLEPTTEPYARPLDMFLSEVDKDKYPNVEQQYRFEKIGENYELFEKETIC